MEEGEKQRDREGCFFSFFLSREDSLAKTNQAAEDCSIYSYTQEAPEQVLTTVTTATPPAGGTPMPGGKD